MKGKLIIIEGSDGAGKETQTNLLYNYLKGKYISSMKITFPDYSSRSSEPVKMYLSGEFGKNPNDVNAFAASSFYAIDRYASYKTKWGKFYNDGGIVISDRYTTSNMVHQASKINNKKDKDYFLDWLYDFEFNKIGLPLPDMVFFLKVPTEFSLDIIKNRKYSYKGNIKRDIHETNTEYLKDTYENSLYVAEKYNWNIIECVKNNSMRTIDDISSEIIKKLSL